MKDKAFQARKDKRVKEKSHMKALGYDENTEDEDGDEEDDDTIFTLGVPADLSIPSEIKKSFNSTTMRMMLNLSMLGVLTCSTTLLPVSSMRRNRVLRSH